LIIDKISASEENDPDFHRYLNIVNEQKFGQQVGSMIVRRF
jgi:hypothetical protein